MLLQLAIRSIALIDRLEIAFGPGLNVLTGETGAGKSIVVGSLDFVLGGRADKDRIAGDALKGQVEALFDVSRQARVLALLEEMGLEAEDGLLPIQREIHRNGRSLCRVAGVTVPLAQLKRVTSLLVDLHGQHAHQSLLDPATHLGFLDGMGDAAHRARVQAVRAAHEAWSQAQRALTEASQGALERARREDMLRFQLDELDGAALREGEETELEQQRTVMRNAEKIREAVERAYAFVSGGVGEEGLSGLDALRAALEALASVARYGESYEHAHDQLAEAVYAIESVAEDIDGLRDAIEADPAALEGIEARLDLLGKLRRKYGATSREMIAYRERVREELDASEHSQARLEALERQEKALRATLLREAEALCDARHTLAVRFRAQVLEQLAQLGMAGARFDVRFAPPEPDRAPTADGMDRVEFLLSANAGEPLRPLARVASGGELSRIMLAFKCIEADSEGIPVLVFDEVDTGISGHMGQVVAEKMLQTARGRQVLCVTHLPQIAALADAQYLVEKSECDGRTRTSVRALDGPGRVEAVARLLGGGETAVAHARAMLSKRPPAGR